MMKKILCAVLFLMLVPVVLVHATPDLGVYTDTGWYADMAGSSRDGYIGTFAKNFTSATDGNEGFIIGQSGSYLTVFVKASAINPFVQDVYFMSNTGGNNFPLSFGSQALDLHFTDIGQIDGYRNAPRDYYGALLPKDQNLWGTVQLESLFYTYRAPLSYGGSLALRDYFFVAADLDGAAGLQFAGVDCNGGGPGNDRFSPKTDSAIGGYTPTAPVPEPGSLWLLGTGILGIIPLRARWKRS